MCVCVCASGETVVGPGFMNGKRAFVISWPYLVTGFVQREDVVYAAQNKMWPPQTSVRPLQAEPIAYL